MTLLSQTKDCTHEDLHSHLQMAPFKDKGSKKANISVKEPQNPYQGFSCSLNLWLEVYFYLNSGMQRRERKNNLSIAVANFSQNRNCSRVMAEFKSLKCSSRKYHWVCSFRLHHQARLPWPGGHDLTCNRLNTARGGKKPNLINKTKQKTQKPTMEIELFIYSSE